MEGRELPVRGATLVWRTGCELECPRDGLRWIRVLRVRTEWALRVALGSIRAVSSRKMRDTPLLTTDARGIPEARALWLPALPNGLATNAKTAAAVATNPAVAARRTGRRVRRDRGKWGAGGV